MRTLEFVTEAQLLKKKTDCDFSNIVAGSVGYLKAKFHFSKEWDDCRKAASFWLDGNEYSVLLDADDTCLIPPLALTGDRFLVSVTGVKSEYKIKTTKTKVRQEVY